MDVCLNADFLHKGVCTYLSGKHSTFYANFPKNFQFDQKVNFCHNFGAIALLMQSRTYAKNPVSDQNCRFFREILTQKPGF